MSLCPFIVLGSCWVGSGSNFALLLSQNYPWPMQYALLACSWSAAGVLVACCWHTPGGHPACPWHAHSTLLACTFALSLCLGLAGVGNGSNFALLLSQSYPKTIPTLSQNPKSILGALQVHAICTPGLLLVCCWRACCLLLAYSWRASCLSLACSEHAPGLHVCSFIVLGP